MFAGNRPSPVDPTSRPPEHTQQAKLSAKPSGIKTGQKGYRQSTCKRMNSLGWIFGFAWFTGIPSEALTGGRGRRGSRQDGAAGRALETQSREAYVRDPPKIYLLEGPSLRKIMLIIQSGSTDAVGHDQDGIYRSRRPRRKTMEYLCDYPGCPNVATHLLGSIPALRLIASVCNEHLPDLPALSGRS